MFRLSRAGDLQGRRVAKHLAEEASKLQLQNRAKMYVSSMDGSATMSAHDACASTWGQVPAAGLRRHKRMSVDVRSRRQSALPAIDLHSQLVAVLVELSDIKRAMADLTSNKAASLAADAEV